MSFSAAGAAALRRSNRGKCAYLWRDLDATGDLPPHCPLFAVQLVDLTHRRWSESEGPDVEEGEVFTLAAAAYFGIKLHSARYPDPAPFLPPDLRQPARSLTDLLTGSCRYSGQAPTLQRATSAHSILDTLNYEVTIFTPADWVCLFETRFSPNVEHLRQRFPQGTGLTALTALARPFRGTRKHGPASGK